MNFFNFSNLAVRLASICQETIENCIPFHRIASSGASTDEQISDVRGSEMSPYERIGAQDASTFAGGKQSSHAEEEASQLISTDERSRFDANAQRGSSALRAIATLDEEKIVNKLQIEREKENFFSDVDLNESDNIEFNSTLGNRSGGGSGSGSSGSSRNTGNRAPAAVTNQSQSAPANARTTLSEQFRHEDLLEVAKQSVKPVEDDEGGDAQDGWLGMDDNDLQL